LPVRALVTRGAADSLSDRSTARPFAPWSAFMAPDFNSTAPQSRAS